MQSQFLIYSKTYFHYILSLRDLKMNKHKNSKSTVDSTYKKEYQ